MSGQLTRRRLLSAASAMVGLGGVAALSGCGLPALQVAPGVGGDRSDREPYLNMSLYPDYIDGAPDGPFQTLAAFEAESGLRVSLDQDVTDVELYMDAVRARFERGLPPATDLLIMPDPLVYPFKRSGWLQRYDVSDMPGVYQNLNPVLFDSPADRRRLHSIPWAGGMTGIAYNAALLPAGVKSAKQLLTDPALHGRVGVFEEMIAGLPTLACSYGTNPAEMAEPAVQRCLDAVDRAARSGQIAAAYLDLDYLDAFRSGRVVAGLAYSGDILNLREELPDLRFVIPEQGAELWVDSLVVPAGAPHRDNAQSLLEFYYRPENAATLAAALKFVCPVPAAQAVLARSDPELAASPLLFPGPAILRNLTMLRVIKADELRRWQQSWADSLLGLPR